MTQLEVGIPNVLARKRSQQNYLMGELESLGLSTIRLNEFNDNYELNGLVGTIKENFLIRYKKPDNRERIALRDHPTRFWQLGLGSWSMLTCSGSERVAIT